MVFCRTSLEALNLQTCLQAAVSITIVVRPFYRLCSLSVLAQEMAWNSCGGGKSPRTYPKRIQTNLFRGTLRKTPVVAEFVTYMVPAPSCLAPEGIPELVIFSDLLWLSCHSECWSLSNRGTASDLIWHSSCSAVFAMGSTRHPSPWGHVRRA